MAMERARLAAFVAEVREFFEREYPRDLLEKQRGGVILSRDDHIRNQRALHARGWLAGAWPVEHGGAGWSLEEQHVFAEEAARAGAPALLPMAITYVGPVIYTFGTEEQKRRWLPDILESRALWAQGYSEPEAGSDLAALGMSAVRDGDHYVLNGAKIWTTYAQYADWIFCLVRTSREARRQAGITFLCVEMASPGVRVHPIVTIDGVHHLNRVEFDNVRAPVSQRIGEEGEGWRYATFLLQGERLSYAHVGQKQTQLKRLRALASATPIGDGRKLLDLGSFAARLASCEIKAQVLGTSVARIMALGDAAAAAHVSALKIEATQLAQEIDEIEIEVAGVSATAFADRRRPDWPAAMPLVPQTAPPAMANYLFDRAQTIFGGATEVQKNIVWRELSR